jgi:ribonuclease J
MMNFERNKKMNIRPLKIQRSNIRVERDYSTKVVGYTPPAKKTTMHSPHLDFPRLEQSAKALEKEESKSPESKMSGLRLRVVPLGGLEEVGKNMMLFEYGQDIVIVDMGLSYPDESMLGIDYVIPDTTYLEDKKTRIRGVVITHGHLDHIGAIPYLISKLGFPTIYTLKLTSGMIEKRLEEFGLAGKVKIITVTAADILRLGNFRIELFRVNHNIPDGVGLAIHTPAGTVVHTGDFKFDQTPVGDLPADFGKIARLGNEGVLALFSDSTNAEVPGSTVSEREVGKVIDSIFAEAKGRIFAATFSTLVARVQQFLWAAQKYGRQVTIIGRSMEENIEVARNLRYLDVPKGIIVENKQAKDLPDNKVLVLLTGSQGEERSALNRIARGEHKFFQIKKGDTVILSSSPIPGNERSITGMMDSLIRDGARVIYKAILGVHTSGHAGQEDLKLMINLVRPKFLIPIHGERHMLAAHADLGRAVGLPEENILVCDNGQVMEFAEGQGKITDQKVPTGYVFVDGLGVGDVGNVVIRDRQKMAEDGMFVVIATVAEDTGKLVTSPDIISRGFIYMRESTDIVEGARAMIKKMFAMGKNIKEHPASWDYVKTKIRDELGEYLFEKTQRRPLVLPVIIEV